MTHEAPSGAAWAQKRVRRTGPKGGKHYQYAWDTPTKLIRTHKAICDLLIANPTATYKSIAEAMGMSAYTISNLVHNDAFKAYMETRQHMIVDPAIRTAYKETCEKLFTSAAEILAKELADKPSFERALSVLERVGKARGMIERGQTQAVQVNMNFPSVLEEARQRARVVQAIDQPPA